MWENARVSELRGLTSPLTPFQSLREFLNRKLPVNTALLVMETALILPASPRRGHSHKPGAQDVHEADKGIFPWLLCSTRRAKVGREGPC